MEPQEEEINIDMGVINTVNDTVIKNPEDSQNKSQGDKQENNQNKISVKYDKISDVDKKERISLDEYTTFKFSCTLKDNYIYLTLSEIGALCPFIYQSKLSHDDFNKVHQAFISCKDLEEIKWHIDRLFEQNRICIDGKNGNDSLKLKIKINYFADEVEKPIEKYKIMTDNKDETLEELYKIQKHDQKVFKDIRKYMEDHGLNDALKKLNDLEKEIKN